MDTNLNGLRGSHPYFITQRGADWAASKQLMPEDSAEYMKLVKQLVPALDPVIEQYISEGLSSFVGRHYFASAVMVGAASEKAVYMLGDSMYGALKDPKDQKDLQSFLNGRSMKQLFDFIREKLEKTIDLGAKKCPIPYCLMRYECKGMTQFIHKTLPSPRTLCDCRTVHFRTLLRRWKS